MIELKQVIYDVRARDGTWCRLPYPNHPKGCPKFPKCPSEPGNIDFLSISLSGYKWYAIIEEFDLKSQAEKMKLQFPKWSERQCRNLLYWQSGVMLRLLAKAYENWDQGDIVLTIPEATGINIFETMARIGITIERNPDMVRKIMMIGKQDGRR